MNITKIISDNEQDRAEADAWWRDSSIELKLRVWLRIQKHHDDTVDEVITRLAQLAFGELAEKHLAEKHKGSLFEE